jgi:GNAT superfamily N-acetyltransferase
MLDLASDQSRALATITSAFAGDPVERWLLPDDADYAAHFPEFTMGFAERAMKAGTAWQLADYAAVAVWLPPGVEPDAERVATVLRASVAVDKHDDMFSVLEQMDAVHPRYPHWYLPWLAVDSSRQGSGLGGQLLAQCLEYIDISKLPVFIEVPNPRSLPFYERHGFTSRGTAQSGTCPPVELMLRDAA